MIDSITFEDVTSDDYLALRLPPGTVVEYRGSISPARGTWTVQPCACPVCMTDVMLGCRAGRYELVDAEGKASGVDHVRHTSVVPVVGEEERDYAGSWVSTTTTAVHLRRMLRKAFPGQKFSVRCGRRTGKGMTPFEITVTWSGGPSSTAVATVTAPLLAAYGDAKYRRPRPVTVTIGERTHNGHPNVHAIHLDRS